MYVNGEKITDPARLREAKIRKRVAMIQPNEIEIMRERAYMMYENQKSSGNFGVFLDENEEVAINQLTMKLLKNQIIAAVDDPNDDFEY